LRGFYYYQCFGPMGCILGALIYASSKKTLNGSSIPECYTANRWFGPTMVCGSKNPRLRI
jgi:hypothetical protein